MISASKRPERRRTMAPPREPPQAMEDAKAAGLQPMTTFLKRETAGRPKKLLQPPQSQTISYYLSSQELDSRLYATGRPATLETGLDYTV